MKTCLFTSLLDSCGRGRKLHAGSVIDRLGAVLRSAPLFPLRAAAAFAPVAKLPLLRIHKLKSIFRHRSEFGPS